MFDHCLYFNTTALARQLERVWSEAFKPFSLTPSQAFTLRAVLQKPGMLHSELAETLRIARATATRAVDGLVARGLLERRSTKQDGRESEIHPTSEAMKIRNDLDAASGMVTARLKDELGDGVFSGFVRQARSIGSRLP
ncbi:MULTISPECIES: MarR family winged helix-turn-helix transcriptional regulator [Rhizobiaceae]|jgi:DNA-binding MarR family transcriptional regulator|uniref:DNA-binding MarR family transcriptional regulator n=1 Tax=Aliirhizobium cellulosilyticum TaxID=393664 RepID=A0A7W6Y4Q5_9HYPH|nr:MarR family transcriptional regulator [Rhizobium cellulosilyticum]MBB4348971.1 DNA-binding MarR family transcriptional regulator [Rhizobium cellulosilyticum]MBB4412808.1 DNA-binding MarR family transcriptional regulator [Rhizobium cellulosilyticum]MBB4447440.1 DNA-binding MarR family transcriptional regulator [Rhizobium cellulosilyticum]